MLTRDYSQNKSSLDRQIKETSSQGFASLVKDLICIRIRRCQQKSWIDLIKLKQKSVLARVKPQK